MLLMCVFPYVFFNCYLTAPQPVLHQYGGGHSTYVNHCVFNYFNPKVTEGAKNIIIVHSFLRSKPLLLYLLVKLLSMGIFTIDFIMSVGLLVCRPCVFPLQ